MTYSEFSRTRVLRPMIADENRAFLFIATSALCLSHGSSPHHIRQGSPTLRHAFPPANNLHRRAKNRFKTLRPALASCQPQLLQYLLAVRHHTSSEILAPIRDGGSFIFALSRREAVSAAGHAIYTVG